jgi:hypothetical protein
VKLVEWKLSSKTRGKKSGLISIGIEIFAFETNGRTGSNEALMVSKQQDNHQILLIVLDFHVPIIPVDKTSRSALYFIHYLPF